MILKKSDKIEKYSQKNVRIVYNPLRVVCMYVRMYVCMYVCMYRLYVRIIVCERIGDI